MKEAPDGSLILCTEFDCYVFAYLPFMKYLTIEAYRTLEKLVIYQRIRGSAEVSTSQPPKPIAGELWHEARTATGGGLGV